MKKFTMSIITIILLATPAMSATSGEIDDFYRANGFDATRYQYRGQEMEFSGVVFSCGQPLLQFFGDEMWQIYMNAGEIDVTWNTENEVLSVGQNVTVRGKFSGLSGYEQRTQRITISLDEDSVTAKEP